MTKELAALDYIPGPAGYARLKKDYGKDAREAPGVRTVQKLIFHNELVKYSMCDGVIKLLNVARAAKGMALLPLDVIEGHEFHVADLESTLNKIARRSKANGVKTSAGALIREIARESGKAVHFIKALIKGHRTTRDRCIPIRETIKALFGDDCTVTDALKPGPQLSKASKKKSPGKGKRKVKAVPAILRD